MTNRAVSKWEIGKNIPDVSIMLELCRILGITVNELLSRERITTMDEYQKKAERTMVDLQEKKTQAQRSLFRVSLTWLAMAVLLTPVQFGN